VVRIVKSGLWDWIVVSVRESIRSQTGKMCGATAALSPIEQVRLRL
jgi:hypothetical protein